mgnify:CR=1 FL=1
MVKITPVDISKVYTETAKVAKRPRVRIQRVATRVTEEEIAANKGVKRAANQYTRKTSEEQIYSNYLQLARLNGKTRFRLKQTSGIAQTLNWYQTTQDKTSLLKEMLSIGLEHGTPLKASEIKGYLSVTSGMTGKEQNNVLDFLRRAKEFVEEKYSMDDLKKQLPYSKFRDLNLELVAGDTEKTQEHVLRNLYEKTMKKQYSLKNQTFFLSSKSSPSLNISEALTNGLNMPLVNAVAKTDDVQAIFDLIRFTGMNQTVVHSLDPLLDILKVSGGNGNIIMDLSTAFYPAEIKQIAAILKKEAQNGSVKNLKLYEGVSSSGKILANGEKGFLSTQRNEILKDLGLSGKIKLISMSSEPSRNKYKH